MARPKAKNPGHCEVCGKPISGNGRLYCQDCVPPVKQGGYILVYAPDHERANGGGYVREHIIVAEQTLGRSLKPGEVVHHKDKNKSNNDPENLMVFPSCGAHLRHHAILRRKAAGRKLREISRVEWLLCWYKLDGVAPDAVRILSEYGNKACRHAARIVGILHVALVKKPHWKKGGWRDEQTEADYAREQEDTFLAVVESYIAKLEAGESVTYYNTVNKLLKLAGIDKGDA